MGTWPSPHYLEDEHLDGTNMGNYHTCQVQGFIAQLGGFATYSFNISLAVIYLLMIRYNWKEEKRRALVGKLTTVLWLVAIGTATIPLVLDMYHNAGPICWIYAYPYNCTESWESPLSDEEQQQAIDEEVADCTAGANAMTAIAFLQIVPTWLGILNEIAIMIAIYNATLNLVKLQERNQSIRFSSTQSGVGIFDNDETVQSQTCGKHPDVHGQMKPARVIGNRSQAEDSYATNATTASSADDAKKRLHFVIVQAISYIAGFLLTFGLSSITIIVFLISGSWNVPLDMVSYFLMPFQGFWNLLVFCHCREMNTGCGKLARALIYGAFGGLSSAFSCIRGSKDDELFESFQGYRSDHMNSWETGGDQETGNPVHRKQCIEEEENDDSNSMIGDEKEETNSSVSSEQLSCKRDRLNVAVLVGSMDSMSDITVSRLSVGGNSNPSPLVERARLRWGETEMDHKPIKPLRRIGETDPVRMEETTKKDTAPLPPQRQGSTVV
eukprot:scaffold5704_cov174-Amphora_coffeaeformis.AAC.2